MRLVLKGTDVSGNDERFDNSKLSCICNVTRWSEQKFQFPSLLSELSNGFCYVVLYESQYDEDNSKT